MATQSVSAGEAWINITTSLSLTNGQNYLIQNKSSRLGFVAEAMTEPPLTQGFRLKPDGFLSITPQAGMSHWVRAFQNNSIFVVSESN